jgi:hypothetical protein
MLRAARAAVSSTRRDLVSGRLAAVVHSRIARRVERGKPSQWRRVVRVERVTQVGGFVECLHVVEGVPGAVALRGVDGGLSGGRHQPGGRESLDALFAR